MEVGRVDKTGARIKATIHEVLKCDRLLNLHSAVLRRGRWRAVRIRNVGHFGLQTKKRESGE